MNVPAPSERTIRRDIAASDITLDAQIQVCTKPHLTLKEMKVPAFISGFSPG